MSIASSMFYNMSRYLLLPCGAPIVPNPQPLFLLYALSTKLNTYVPVHHKLPNSLGQSFLQIGKLSNVRPYFCHQAPCNTFIVFLYLGFCSKANPVSLTLNQPSVTAEVYITNVLVVTKYKSNFKTESPIVERKLNVQ